MTVPILLWLLAVVGLGVRAEPPAAPEPATPVAPVVEPAPDAAGAAAHATKIIDRVAVIGASISAGYNTSGVMGLPAGNLADVVRKMLPREAVVESYADTLLFVDPEGRSTRQVERVRQSRPTLIFAIDFPFWWVYGIRPEAERAAALEHGLKMLLAAQEAGERIGGKPVPVLISLLPDTNGMWGPTLPDAFQTPEPRTIAACNDRLKAWAAEHEGVIIVPLLEDFVRIRANEKLRLGGAEIDPAKSPAMIQGDKLHTTVDGLAFVAGRCVESLVQHGVIAEGQIKYDDPAEVAQRLRTEGPK